MVAAEVGLVLFDGCICGFQDLVVVDDARGAEKGIESRDRIGRHGDKGREVTGKDGGKDALSRCGQHPLKVDCGLERAEGVESKSLWLLGCHLPRSSQVRQDWWSVPVSDEGEVDVQVQVGVEVVEPVVDVAGQFWMAGCNSTDTVCTVCGGILALYGVALS